MLQAQPHGPQHIAAQQHCQYGILIIDNWLRGNGLRSRDQIFPHPLASGRGLTFGDGVPMTAGQGKSALERDCGPYWSQRWADHADLLVRPASGPLRPMAAAFAQRPGAAGMSPALACGRRALAHTTVVMARP